jgi:rSAM/selenodomain-associated transferase 2
VTKLSVIIPTLDAEAHLAACLERMKPADEILVVDGGSSDRTMAIAREAGVRLVLAPRGRGTQLRAGGEAAGGDWLLFLHADTLPGRNWPAAVTAHTTRQADKAGCFRFRLADKSRQARWIERAVATRVRLLGLPYGDQGLLVSRPLYEKVGGYRPLPLMEDVDLVRRLGRRQVASLDEHASTSAEKWLRDGWLRRSARNLACLGLFSLGVPPERLARIYG